MSRSKASSRREITPLSPKLIIPEKRANILLGFEIEVEFEVNGEFVVLTASSLSILGIGESRSLRYGASMSAVFPMMNVKIKKKVRYGDNIEEEDEERKREGG